MVLRAAVPAIVLVILSGCGSSAVSGSGSGAARPSQSSSGGFVLPSEVSSTPSQSASTPLSSQSSPPLHPVPSAPLRTATASTPDGTSYVLKIWAEVRTPLCSGHAYGAAVINFLIVHPCRGLTRDLITTVVKGKGVGLATSTTSFPGTQPDVFKVASDFRKLVTQNGTGNFSDLLREGYRLPSGPTQVPSPDAFNALGQDSGVVVYDMWYLNGPTPDNDPALIKLSQDIFLQF